MLSAENPPLAMVAHSRLGQDDQVLIAHTSTEFCIGMVTLYHEQNLLLIPENRFLGKQIIDNDLSPINLLATPVINQEQARSLAQALMLRWLKDPTISQVIDQTKRQSMAQFWQAEALNIKLAEQPEASEEHTRLRFESVGFKIKLREILRHHLRRQFSIN